MRFSLRLGRRFEPPGDVRAFTAELERYFTRELGARAGAHAPAESSARQIEDAPTLRG
jgi:hypothetical protein